MVRNFLKIFLRNLKKNPLYSILNILGLAIGLALVFLIVLYIHHETSYDTYNKKADRIYRVLNHRKDMDWIEPGTSFLLAPVLRDKYPDVEAVARTRGIAAEIEFNEEFEWNFFNCVDPDIFDILTLEFVYGSRERALVEPYDILLSETRAAKYFPDENPVGKILSAKICGEIIEFTVKGVLKNAPTRSTFSKPFLVNIDIAKKFFQFIQQRYDTGDYEEQWYLNYYQTYILLKEDVDTEAFVDKMNDIPVKYHDEGMQFSYDLQPLLKIYFHSNELTNNPTWSGKLSDIYLFSSIAFLILFIACTNFIILSTVQSSLRSKEIAMRKVVGAERKNLIKQILFESVFIAFVSCLIAVGFTYLFRPVIENYLHTTLEIHYLKDYLYSISLLLITLFVGLESGSFSTFHISRLNPLIILQSRISATSSKSFFRRILICFQMIIFICLISSSIIIYKQLHFFRNTDMGFDKEQLLALYLTSGDFSEHYEAFMTELSKCPDIIEAAGAFEMPPDDGSMSGKIPLFDDPDQSIIVEECFVYYNFFETFGIDLLSGRPFSREFASDTQNSIILNETAVKRLHLKDPIGKFIENDKIIGVVKDFHYHSLYYEVEPTIFKLSSLQSINGIAVRLSPYNVSETIDYIKHTWKSFNKGSDAPFKYDFIDEKINQMYLETQNFGKVINFCTIFAIFVACLGLLGLTMFITKQKTKEIGIRKVFGASPFSILKHLSKEIILLSFISTLISVPIVLYLMNKWLENFAYNTEISFWIFIISGLTGLFISLLTMSFLSIKASLANPVDTMKYE